MKKDLHPEYYPAAKVKCACGHSFTVGATRPEFKVEICSHCHPFYTGQEKIIDTAGRVEKFKARTTKAKSGLISRRQKSNAKRTRQAKTSASK